MNTSLDSYNQIGEWIKGVIDWDKFTAFFSGNGMVDLIGPVFTAFISACLVALGIYLVIKVLIQVF